MIPGRSKKAPVSYNTTRYYLGLFGEPESVEPEAVPLLFLLIPSTLTGCTDLPSSASSHSGGFIIQFTYVLRVWAVGRFISPTSGIIVCGPWAYVRRISTVVRLDTFLYSNCPFIQLLKPFVAIYFCIFRYGVSRSRPAASAIETLPVMMMVMQFTKCRLTQLCFCPLSNDAESSRVCLPSTCMYLPFR